MPDLPVHAQPIAEVTDEVRALNKRGADLCRRDPALFSRMVQFSDALEREGVERHEAHRLALDAAEAKEARRG